MTYKGYSMTMKRYKISLWVLKNVLKYFQHEKLNFISPSGHFIILFIYLLYEQQMEYQSFHFKMFLKVLRVRRYHVFMWTLTWYLCCSFLYSCHLSAWYCIDINRYQPLNPLIPKSNQDRISPYSINTMSSRQVMRIKTNIN